jgi:hypothetical protein
MEIFCMKNQNQSWKSVKHKDHKTLKSRQSV